MSIICSPRGKVGVWDEYQYTLETGLLKRNAVKDIACKLSVFKNEEVNRFFQPYRSQFKLRRQIYIFLDTIQKDEDAKQTLSKLVCSFALEYTRGIIIMPFTKDFPAA